ncbi:MAG: dihydroxy-acid dehydratase, partial [Armatimonadetes bacterium]|nr:dihydroxy-acid dehydratase [Armatimonadota bacterium]
CAAGPRGSGMEETYQLTGALKYLPFGRQVALVTDARFSGVSTGACVGHVGPEALDGGPLGKLLDGDLVSVEVDCDELDGRVDLVGCNGRKQGAAWGTQELARRESRPDLAPDPELPPETRLWAALQAVGGGTWGGCVYDVDAIVARLEG